MPSSLEGVDDSKMRLPRHALTMGSKAFHFANPP